MTRRRWRQMPDGTLVEVDLNAPRQVGSSGDAVLWGDRSYDGLRAPDGTDISSRTKHREYMRATGMTTVDDYVGEFSRAQAERDRYHSAGGSVRRADVERAIYELKNR